MSSESERYNEPTQPLLHPWGVFNVRLLMKQQQESKLEPTQSLHPRSCVQRSHATEIIAESRSEPTQPLLRQRSCVERSPATEIIAESRSEPTQPLLRQRSCVERSTATEIIAESWFDYTHGHVVSNVHLLLQ